MSRRRWALVVAAVALLAAGCAGLDVGNVLEGGLKLIQSGDDLKGAFAEIDEPEEVELGRAVTAMIGSRYPLLRDEAVTRYVALVGNTVALQSERPDMRYYFAVLDSDDVNAVAVSGGYIFVTRGALALMRDEATLAGVLGHEVGHIALRHHAKAIKAAKQKAAMRTGAEVGASFTRASALTPAIGFTIDGLGELALKGFSREEEGESDGVGFKYAGAAGYDPAGLRNFLKTLQDRGSKEAAISNFMSTHPGTEERLKAQEALVAKAATPGRRNQARFQQALARIQKR
jgi:predicted Zn-dependent protease